ncbi:hypothetical protein M8J75_009745 [Diaphorina citri]|nr:hypothetical protein M8J75_009745 [Diaphorina citri]
MAETKEILSVVILCLLWYVISSSNNVIGKMLLSDFPYPMTVTMIQLLSITLYSEVFFNMWGIRKYIDLTWSYYFKLIVPLALGKFIASVLTHVSIWKVPVSYAHTVKATMPLFTVYLSLAPIIIGVGVATMTELSFDITGLISALVATLQYSLQNIFSKKVLADTGVHHLRLLHILGRLALVLFLPFWIYFDFVYIVNEPVFSSDSSTKVIFLLCLDGMLSWLQNILAFSVMSLVTSLTYAVASASKRIFVIAVSLLALGNPVTGTNVFGMMLAICGVLAYNKAKYDARNAEKKKTLLPYTQSAWKQNHSINNTAWTSKNKKHSSGNLLYNSSDTKILLSV